MEKLIEIKNSYKNQFFKTGNIYFFMMSHNLDKLINNAKALDDIKEEEFTL